MLHNFFLRPDIRALPPNHFQYSYRAPSISSENFPSLALTNRLRGKNNYYLGNRGAVDEGDEATGGAVSAGADDGGDQDEEFFKNLEEEAKKRKKSKKKDYPTVGQVRKRVRQLILLHNKFVEEENPSIYPILKKRKREDDNLKGSLKEQDRVIKERK